MSTESYAASLCNRPTQELSHSLGKHAGVWICYLLKLIKCKYYELTYWLVDFSMVDKMTPKVLCSWKMLHPAGLACLSDFFLPFSDFSPNAVPFPPHSRGWAQRPPSWVSLRPFLSPAPRCWKHFHIYSLPLKSFTGSLVLSFWTWKLESDSCHLRVLTLFLLQLSWLSPISATECLRTLLTSP